MSETLMHYAAEPLTFDRDRTYEQSDPITYGKPRGLWVSAKGVDDWPTWCSDNEFDVDRTRYAHEVTLADSADVLQIHSPEGMNLFTKSFSVETEWERRWSWRGHWSKWPIDWRLVAGQFDGLIIAPYQWSQRNNLSWYYGWDCASGCIWNLDAIASVTPVPAEVSA